MDLSSQTLDFVSNFPPRLSTVFQVLPTQVN